MDVIVDANILIPDLWLRSQNMRLLIDYLRKTQSCMLLSQVVEAEVKAYAKRHFKGLAHKLEAASGSALRNGLVDVPEIFGEQITQNTFAKWEDNFRRTLTTSIMGRIPLDEKSLPEVLRRATERVVPCKESGEGLRDAIIWLNSLEFCSMKSKKTFAFLSANTSDFAAGDKTSLRPELVSDAQRYGLEIKYYASLEAFLKENAEPIQHITLEWIKERLDVEAAEKVVRQYLETSDLHDKFRIGGTDYQDIYAPYGKSEITYTDAQLEDVHVWEFDDKHIEALLIFYVFANADIDCELVDRPRRPPYSDHDNDDEFLLSMRTLACYAELGFEISAEIQGDSIDHLYVEDVYRY